MKNNQFLHLLKAELRGPVFDWLLFGLFLATLNFAYLQGFQQSYRLSGSPTQAFGAVAIWMIFLHLFQNPTKSLYPSAMGGYEFLFTKAITRRTLFYSKAGAYLIASLLPVVLSLVLSFSKPELKLRIYENSPEAALTEQFCLANFDGAHLQSDPEVQGAHFVVMPTGWVDEGFYFFFIYAAAALAYQFGVFLVWPRYGVILPAGVILAASGLQFYFVFSRKLNDFESQIAWASHHRLPLLLGLAVAAVCIQLFSCRRFVNTEVLA